MLIRERLLHPVPLESAKLPQCFVNYVKDLEAEVKISMNSDLITSVKNSLVNFLYVASTFKKCQLLVEMS